MKLIVELDDATGRDQLAAILDALAAFRPYVRGAVLPVADGPVVHGQEAEEAWHLALLEHRRRVRAESCRYRAECARLRELSGPPAGAANLRPAGESPRWHQADLDDLAREDPVSDDEAVFRTADGTWFAADARWYLPPCEITEG